MNDSYSDQSRACDSERGYGSNAELLQKMKDGDESAFIRLCEQNGGLVKKIALRFVGRGVEFEDLVQIGSIGMIKAIRSFDVERGCALSTYAVPLIMGEIKRYLRDDGLIKIGREQKRLGAQLLRERERLVAKNGCEPGISELASIVGITPEEATYALEAASPVAMLSDPIFDEDSATLESTVCDEEEEERTFESILLSEAISTLPPLWRKIIVCRYFHDMSQQKTAQLLSLSQVKISREEKKILSYLRSKMQ